MELVDAAKAGNNVRFGIYDRRWTRNARSIATFLSGANPYWSKKDVMDLLELHLQLTKGEAVARLEGNWEADVAAFDEIFTEMLTLSDALSEGIVHQFAEVRSVSATMPTLALGDLGCGRGHLGA